MFLCVSLYMYRLRSCTQIVACDLRRVLPWVLRHKMEKNEVSPIAWAHPKKGGHKSVPLQRICYSFLPWRIKIRFSI
jgi:hypothetical protein